MMKIFWPIALDYCLCYSCPMKLRFAKISPITKYHNLNVRMQPIYFFVIFAFLLVFEIPDELHTERSRLHSHLLYETFATYHEKRNPSSTAELARTSGNAHYSYARSVSQSKELEGQRFLKLT